MDYSSQEGFLSKAKWIFSSLSGIIMLWASRLPYPMHTPKQAHCRLPFTGLKTLIYPQGHPLQNPNHTSLILPSHMTSSSPPPSPSPSSSSSSSSSWTTSSSPSNSSLFQCLTNSSSWCSAVDDFLGTESGVYMNSSDYELEITGDKSEEVHNRCLAKRSQRVSAMTKEYPPPLSQLPRVLTRHYENGNLLLKEEGLQQYFETTRENGRLIMNMVQLEDDRIAISDGITEKNNKECELELLEGIESIKEEQEDSVEYQETESDDDGEDDLENEARIYEESSVMILTDLRKMPGRCSEDDEIESGGGRGIRTCFTYTGRRSLEWETNYGLPGSAPLAVTARRVTTVM